MAGATDSAVFRRGCVLRPGQLVRGPYFHSTRLAYYFNTCCVDTKLDRRAWIGLDLHLA